MLPAFSVTVTSLIDRAGTPSLSRMVPTPWPSATPAFTAPDRLRENVSSSSSTVSPCTATVMVVLVSPGANVSVPPTAVKSLPAVAVPLAVA